VPWRRVTGRILHCSREATSSGVRSRDPTVHSLWCSVKCVKLSKGRAIEARDRGRLSQQCAGSPQRRAALPRRRVAEAPHGAKLPRLRAKMPHRGARRTHGCANRAQHREKTAQYCASFTHDAEDATQWGGSTSTYLRERHAFLREVHASFGAARAPENETYPFRFGALTGPAKTGTCRFLQTACNKTPARWLL
jgi:hypothetical protein